jgi:hypothetical protein
VINDDRNMNKEKGTYSDITGAVTGRGEDDLDAAADMSDPPATEALRDPPDSGTKVI